ncbi:MAG: DUF899 domain-containing protein [Candidatus Acidiferrales bacterium]
MSTATQTHLAASTPEPVDEPRIATHSEWIAARKDFLSKEKQLTHMRDELARLRRELPWEKVEKPYSFDGPHGRVSLAELFGDKSQLVIYHFMFAPEWEAGCSSCSMVADGINASIVHFDQRDVAFSAVSRAPIAKLEAFRKRLGWDFNWVSSHASDFNYDYRVSFTPDQVAAKIPNYNYDTVVFPMDEAPGLSVFAKKGGDVYHTYSTFGRGLEPMLVVYDLLDWTPVGRGEEGLARPMSWVRHRDRYETKTAALRCCEHKD